MRRSKQRKQQSNSAEPELCRQTNALQLACRALRNLVENQNSLGHLEVGGTLAHEVLQFALGRLLTFTQHDRCSHFFAELRMRHAEAHHLRHGRVIMGGSSQALADADIVAQLSAAYL